MGAEHVPDIASICVALDNGDIILYEIETNTLDIVGTIETGVTAMQWSPDFEIVVFTTKASTLLLMTIDFEAIIETSLVPEDELSKRTESHVSVYNTAPVPLPSEGHIDVSSNPSISWRGDGNFFAVSTLEGGKHCFRVWERTGQFHSKSEENIQGQGNFVAWRPSGEVIASYQEYDHIKQVVFFERNGLKRYDFPLRTNNAKFKDIQWNAEGDILSIVLETESEHLLQLWTTKNYHWYLKQEFHFNKDTEKLVNIAWNIESSMSLFAYFEDGRINQYFLNWDVDESFSLKVESKAQPTYNDAVVAVIDGTRLLLTPFKRMTIPPPLSTTFIDISVDVENSGTINAVCFDNLENQIIITSSTGHILIYSPYTPQINVGAPSVFNCPPKFIASQHNEDFKRLRHIQSVESSDLFAIRSDDDGKDVFIHYKYDIDGKSIELNVENEHSYPRDKNVLRVTINPNTATFYLQLDNGTISSYDFDECSFSNHSHLKLPSACYWIKATTFCDEDVIVGLSGTSKLYIRDKLVSNECNSFHIGSDYLMFTTLTHKLRFMALHLTIDENLTILENAKSRKNDDSLREIEQGSHLITSVYGGTRVVLQMPRGNLEIIDPRALVLHLTRKLLTQTEYGSAFVLMRKHRIDLNLTYDHNPELFTENVAKFIQEVDNIDYINLFISGLKDADITTQDYGDIWHTSESTDTLVSAATIAKRSGQGDFTFSKKTREKLTPLKIGKDKVKANKVNQICNLLKTYFQKSPEKYLLPLLTCLVSKRPPEIEAALTLVQSLREQEIKNEQPHHVSSEKALKYLTFLIDVNLLYNIALGMYDFDLVVLVAQKSQKDPREYLPFLANLQSMPTPIQRYNIDKYLKRWDKALENLSQSEESFGECLDLIKTHNLYTEATRIFKNDPTKLNQVLEIYGDYFLSKKEYLEAGNVFHAGGHLEKAIQSYKLQLEWRKCVTIAYEMNMDEASLKNLYLELAQTLRSNYRYEDSAYVYEHFCKNADEAIQSLTTGCLFNSAVMFCHIYNKKDFIENELKPAALTYKKSIHKEIQDKSVKLMKYHNRLITLRVNKYLQSQHEESPEVEGSENSSMYSGSDSSSTSGRSRYSQSSRSSRRSRKPSKKKLSGRKGSPFEEEFIIQELPLLLPNEKYQHEIKDLLVALYEFGFKDDCKELQDAFGVLMDYATKAQNLLKSVSPKTRDELDEEAKKEKDPLLDAVVNPVQILNVAFSAIDWKLKSIE